MSDVINRGEATKLLREILRRSARQLEGNDMVLALHLSRVIELDGNIDVVDPEHEASLKALNSVTGVVKVFEEQMEEYVVKELGL